MPAIAGTSLFSSDWLPARIAPPPARNKSGSRKLKKAALGLRQNMRRSRRYWRQPSATGLSPRTASAIGALPDGTVGLLGGQLEVDVLEGGATDAQLLESLAAGKRFGGEPGEQRGWVLGLALVKLATAVAPGDAVVRGADAELARRADREHAAVLDDRDAVGELLRLVEIVGR